MDYTIGIQIASPQESFDILKAVNNHTLAQSDHKMLRDRAQCAHIEIKAAGGTMDIRSQLLVWSAAGFQKQEELWKSTIGRAQSWLELKLAPVSLWHWQGDRVQLWIAVKDSAKQRVFIWKEEDFLITRGDPDNFCRLAFTLAQVLDWGCTHHLPWFRTLIGRSDLNS